MSIRVHLWTNIFMKKVGFVSLGCPKNLVDSEVMMGQLAEAATEARPARA